MKVAQLTGTKWLLLVFFAILIVALFCFVAKEVGMVEVHRCETTAAMGNLFQGCQAFGCPEGTTIVASKNSDVYHRCDCPHAERIKEENMLCIKTIHDAEALGYKPCSTCMG